MPANLNSAIPPLRIETYTELSSTQDVMKARLKSGENVDGLVIRALEQTAGRGQRRRDWLSNKGGSYQTLAIKNHQLQKPFAAIAIAIGIAESLPEYGIQVGIKWPNDLYYKGKKVAGILCEYSKGHLLAAVGMNVNNEVPKGVAALRGLNLEDVSTIVLVGIQRGLGHLLEASDLAALFKPYDALVGKRLRLRLGTSWHEGVAAGMNEQCCLLLDKPEGRISICHSQARSSIHVIA